MFQRVKEAEQNILDALEKDDPLPQGAHISLGAKERSYQAQVTINDSDKITSTCDTIKAARQWISSTMESQKSGGISQAMKKAQQAAKAAVEMDNAATQLLKKEKNAAATTQGLSTVAKHVDCADAPGAGAVGSNSLEDMTANFLMPARNYTVQRPPSSIAIHKGSFQSFVNIASVKNNVCALMLGKIAWNKQFHVNQIVMSEDGIASILDHPRVVSKCTSHDLSECGVILVGSPQRWEASREELFKRFANASDKSLVVCVDFEHKPQGDTMLFEYSTEMSTCRSVAMVWTTQPKDLRRRLEYNLCWVDDLGVSCIEKTSQQICEVILREARSKLSQQEPVCQMSSWYTELPMPPDGLCGWHALLACEDLARYKKTPRQSSGFAVSHAAVKVEQAAARDFHQAVCQRAMEVFGCESIYRKDVQRVMAEPAFAPADLQWLCCILECSVRLTCAHEARQVDSRHHKHVAVLQPCT